MACFRERHTHAHTHVHPRESERLEHARTVEKIKMALSSICGMTSAGGCGRGVKRSSSQGVGRYKGSLWDGCGRERTHWRLGKGGREVMVLKVGEIVEAGKPGKGSTQDSSMDSTDSLKWL